MSGYEVAHLDELDRIPVRDGLEWRPVRRRFGIAAFGVNAYTSERVGGHVVEEHTERILRHEELYVVVKGRARFTLDGEELDAPAGTAVFIRDPDVKRVAIAEEEGTTVLALGGKPGEAFTPSAWEWFFEAEPHSRAGDHEAAFAIMADGLARFPDHPAMLFNAACFEARAGKRDEALAHLRRAIEVNPDFAEYARTVSDFDSIREDPGFPS